MLSLKEVQHLKRESGIYSLLKDGEIVYVGRSRNVYCRVLEHIIEGKKKFDTVYSAHNANETLVEIMEVIIIDYLSPKYNVLTIDRDTFLRILPTECKKHIPTDIDSVVRKLVDRLYGRSNDEQILLGYNL